MRILFYSRSSSQDANKLLSRLSSSKRLFAWGLTFNCNLRLHAIASKAKFEYVCCLLQSVACVRFLPMLEKVIGLQRFGRQEVGRCRTRDESKEDITCRRRSTQAQAYIPILKILHTSQEVLNRAIFYCPQRSCRKVMFSQACVNNSVHGGCLPQCKLGYTHPQANASQADTPWADTPRQPLQQTVRILLECILV